MILEVTSDIQYDPRPQDWCRLPYVGHPKGCPNYGKKAGCPPGAKHVDRIFDMDKRFWFVIHKFDLEAHVKKMNDKLPDWSYRQCSCVLYWQRTERKKLKDACEEFGKYGTLYDLCPEGRGVNVFKILRKNGVPVVARPKKTVYMTALVGYHRCPPKYLKEFF